MDAAGIEARIRLDHAGIGCRARGYHAADQAFQLPATKAIYRHKPRHEITAAADVKDKIFIWPGTAVCAI